MPSAKSTLWETLRTMIQFHQQILYKGKKQDEVGGEEAKVRGGTYKLREIQKSPSEKRN